MYCKIYINVLVYLCLLKNYTQWLYQHTDMQNRQCYECSWDVSMYDNEEMLAGYADPDASYPDADPDAS